MYILMCVFLKFQLVCAMLRVQKTIFVMLILDTVIANQTLVETTVKSVLMDFLDSQPAKVCSLIIY